MEGFTLWMLVLVFMIMFILWILRIVTHMTRNYRAGVEGSTLGLVRGSVQTFLVLILTLLTVRLAEAGMVPPEDQKWVMVVYGGVIVFYLLTRRRSTY